MNSSHPSTGRAHGSRALRVCIFQPFGERRGGSDNILFTFLRHVDRARLDPLVVFLGPGGFEREVAALGLRTAVLPPGRLRNPAHVAATVARATRLLRRERPDLILNWLSTAQLYGASAAVAAGMASRTIWWQLDLHRGRSKLAAAPRDRLATLRGRALDQLATALPAAAIGGCSAAVAEAQARMRPRRPTFSVLPGIDPPVRSSEQERRALRAAIGLPEDLPVVGITGRMFAWKGHHLLLDALARLRADGHELHGLFVGGGGHRGDAGYEASLHRLVGELGLERDVTFTGQVPEGARYTELMDVFVNASAPEPFGLVVLEAMAVEVPVVAVDAGGPAEIIEDGVSGMLVPSSSPGDLAPAIGRLLANRELRAQLAVAGRERYERRFTGEQMTREMEARLEELAH